MRITLLYLGFITAALLLVGCWPFKQQHIVTSQVSPDERYIATAYQDSWGPPPKHDTSVAVRGSHAPFRARAENVVFTVDGPRAVGVVWDGSSQLRIVCVGCARDAIIKQEKRWEDITVTVDCYGAAQ